MLPRGYELQDPTPDGVTQDVQRVHAPTLSGNTYISQELFYCYLCALSLSKGEWADFDRLSPH
jgi:hypothetical protein